MISRVIAEPLLLHHLLLLLLLCYMPVRVSWSNSAQPASLGAPFLGAGAPQCMRLRGGEDGEDSSDIIQFYEQILEGNPTSATAHVSLGRVYERKNNFDAAESQYAIAKALNPLDPLCYSYLGQVLLNQRQRPEAAMEEFKQALALSPDAAELHHVMARINHGFGKYEEAKDGYKKTLELQPNDGQTMSDLGSLLEAEDGDQDTVFGLYKQATKFHPDSALVWSNYGRALLNKKKYRDAITSLRNALRIEPDSHHALCNLGAALASFAPDCTEIEDIYARALDLCPFDPSTLVNYGKVCMEKGRVKMAEELFEEALKLEPDMVEAISGLGSIIEHRMTDELDTKRKEQFLNIAEAHHEKALSLLPDNPDVITNYASFLQANRGNRQNEAEELYQRVLSGDPEHACALGHLAGFYNARGRRHEAMELAERAFLLQPWRKDFSTLLEDFPESRYYRLAT